VETQKTLQEKLETIEMDVIRSEDFQIRKEYPIE